MGMILPMIMFVAFLGLNATSAFYEKKLSSQPPAAAAATSAQNFISYKNAVVNFLHANPGFTGTIPAQSLAMYMPGVQTSALSSMGNSIVNNPAGGATITVYAQAMVPGVTAAALSVSQGDASIGTSVGGQWVSAVSPAASGIQTGLPDGTLTYVMQVN